MDKELTIYQPSEDSVVVYRSNDGLLQLDVQLAIETVWLNLNQIVELFDRDKSVISRHIRNIYSEGELEREATVAKNATVQIENGRNVVRQIEYYNLDVIISVGYRVKSKRGTQFRQWANAVLKEYMLRGYAVNNRIERLEHRMAQAENKIDFFVRTSLPPVEGIFFDGQIFDAYKFVSDLVRAAKKRVVLFDNYIDDTVLTMLDKRKKKVSATIYTKSIPQQLTLDIAKHNSQYPPIEVKVFDKDHDRFLCIDNTVYHIGASLKDLSKKWFAFSKMMVTTEELLGNL